MELAATELPGLHLIRPPVSQDARGSFVKTYHADRFRELGIAFEPREEFFSTSAKNVVRGMHFHLPPVAHAKLVYCITGRVLDVVLDLRKNSPTFGKCCARELSAANRLMFFMPVGVAHGFLSLEDNSTMVYQTSTVYSPAQDAGVRWDSFGFHWPVQTPVLSERDLKLPGFREFSSPF